MKQAIYLLISLIVTVGALVYALWDISFPALSALFSNLHYGIVLPFLVILALFYWLKALRWSLLLRPIGNFRWSQVTPAMMIGFGANNILPAHLGDLLRFVVFAKQFKQPFSGIFTSLILERFLDVAAILFLFFIGAISIEKTPDPLRVTAWVAVSCLLIAGLLIAGILYRRTIVVSLWEKMAKKLPHSWQSKGESTLQNIILALSAVKSPKTIAVLFINSLLQWLGMAVMIWLSFMAFDVPVFHGLTFIVLAASALAVTVPSTPGYVGAMQAAFIFALAPFGIADETAFAASVFFMLVQWIPVTLIGAYFFFKSRFKVDELRHYVEYAKKTISHPAMKKKYTGK